ncbi:MAG: hypothetical protein WCP07_13155 [bacterium]|jgi:hypothetical protein
MDVATTGFGDSEIAQKAKAIYESSIRAKVEPEHIGKFLVIDVETGEWDMDADDYAASFRMYHKKPQGKRFAVRIGHRASGMFRGGVPNRD